MNEESVLYQQHRDALNDYKESQQFEHQLIDRKTTWLLTTQGLLFAAYGLSLSDGAGPDVAGDDFRRTVAWSGIVLAVASLVGVSFIIRSKMISWRRFQLFFADAPIFMSPLFDQRLLRWGAGTPNTVMTLVPDVVVPLALVVAWVSLV